MSENTNNEEVNTENQKRSITRKHRKEQFRNTERRKEHTHRHKKIAFIDIMPR